MLCVGCQGTAETAYLISGRVNNPDADGNIIYLSHSNGDELVKKIDAFLLRLARRTFSKTGLADEQLLAEFKLCFLLCNGADLPHDPEEGRRLPLDSPEIPYSWE